MLYCDFVSTGKVWPFEQATNISADENKIKLLSISLKNESYWIPMRSLKVGKCVSMHHTSTGTCRLLTCEGSWVLSGGYCGNYTTGQDGSHFSLEGPIIILHSSVQINQLTAGSDCDWLNCSVFGTRKKLLCRNICPLFKHYLFLMSGKQYAQHSVCWVHMVNFNSSFFNSISFPTIEYKMISVLYCYKKKPS